jgi:hypothetical protein
MLEQTAPSLIIHGGCKVNESAGTQSVPYWDPAYAPFQNAESVLFYMSAVAAMARAKDFWDLPSTVPGALACAGACFGDGWRSYFEHEAADPSLSDFQNGLICKKAHFWSLLGDWTVHLRYPA